MPLPPIATPEVNEWHYAGDGWRWLEAQLKSARALTDSMRRDNERLRSEVERLRMTEEERDLLCSARARLDDWNSPLAEGIEKMQRRLGGGQ